MGRAGVVDRPTILVVDPTAKLLVYARTKFPNARAIRVSTSDEADVVMGQIKFDIIMCWFGGLAD